MTEINPEDIQTWIDQAAADRQTAWTARQATRRAHRTQHQEARTAGLRQRHAAKLARTQEQPMPNPTNGSPTTPAPRFPGRAREACTRTTDPDGVPERRSGRQCGYPHRDRWHTANKELGKALSKLARDRDPAARQAGADIAAAVAELVERAAFLAADCTSASQRAAAQVAAALPKLNRRLDALRGQLGGRGVAVNGRPGTASDRSDPKKANR